MKGVQRIYDLVIERMTPRRTWEFIAPAGMTDVTKDGFHEVTVALQDSHRTIIVSAWACDGIPWIHASITRVDGLMPTYDDLAWLKAAVFGPNGYACQIFPATAEHVNIHDRCLHLWGPLDPKDWPVPKMGEYGSI